MSSQNPLLSALQGALDTQFQPTNAQKQAKSTFWSSFSSGEGSPLPAQSLVMALRFGRDSRLSTWWEIPGFQDWFWNRDEFRQRMEYLAALAIDELEMILTSRSHSAPDKLNAIKLIMQVTGKTGSPATEESLPESIQKMSRTQLEEYIRSGVRLLNPSEDLTVPTKPDTVE